MISEELLAKAAELARQWAPELCNGCDGYHEAWPSLRMAGAISGLRTEAPFFQERLGRAAREGRRRVLIAATADTGMLEQVAEAYQAAGATFEATVLDQCETPLRLNDWYAGQCGFPITTHHGDVFAHEPAAPFDVLCTHSFFSFVPPDRYGALAASWARCLAPGGLLITSQSLRPEAKSDKIRFTREEAVEFADRAVRMAPAPGSDFYRLALRFAENKCGYTVRSAEEIREALTNAGLQLVTFGNADEVSQRSHRPASPGQHGDWSRLQIVAKRAV